MNTWATMRVGAVVATLLAGGATRLTAQAGNIHGRVTRADQPVGLADADVALSPSGVRSSTDPRGFFEFRGVAPGRVELTVRRVGFAPAVVVLQVAGVAPTQVDIALQPAVTILDPIVTSVTRDQRSLSEVAAAVSVADTSAIDRGRTVGLHETLRMMPGVQAASQYGTDRVSIGIRGSAARGAFALRGIAVLLDGIPLTESDGRSILGLIELGASRQIEVARGPASALYAGSPGGVVNVVSRNGRDSRGISSRVLGGAFGFRKYDGHAGGVFAGGRGSGFAAVSYTTADGYRVHSVASTTRGQVAFDFLAGSNTRLAIEANGSRDDLQLPGTLTQPEFDADPDAAAPALLTFKALRTESRYRAGLRVEQASSAGVATGYFLYGGRTLGIRGFETVDGNFHRSQAGARFRSDRVAGSPIDATVGFDYDILFFSDQRWANEGGVRGDRFDNGYASVPNLGLYTQAAWQLSRPVGVTLGVRYDWVGYRFESFVPGAPFPRQERSYDHLSPRLSALWSPDSATSLYASVGRGSEVPIIGELSFGPSAELREVRPKSLWNYEVGARRIVDARVLLEGTVFYSDVRGEFVPITVAGFTVPENASRSRNIGVELGATARVSHQLELGASYTFLDLRLRDYSSEVVDSTGVPRKVDFGGKLLPAVPRHRVTGEARVRPLEAVDFGVQVEWQSIVYVETSNAKEGTWYFQLEPSAPVQAVPFRALPARALVHLNAAWRLGPATLFAGVENLFGLRYAGTIEANDAFGQFYEAGPPASVSLGLRLSGWGPSDTAP